MLAVEFYNAVVALHVMAIVIAFGVTFAYPIMGPYLGKNHPGALPAFHGVQERIGKFLITPFATFALITGIYLAADAEVFDEVFVQVPMVILIVLLGMGGAFFAPLERRALELSANPESAEYQSIAAKIAKGGMVASVLILVAIYFMVAKPFYP